jgi:polysaccharide chain length determinant protein (PEP-CTERM system associated)
MGTPPAKRAINSAFLPLSIVRMVWKHKLLLLLVWSVITAAAVMITNALPPIYEARSLIMVDAQKIPEKFVASTVQISLQDSLESIRQQILSNTRLEKIINEFNLYAEERKKKTPEEIVDMMRKGISTPMERGWGGARAGAFRVVYEGKDPRVVAAVVNQISALFIEENLRTRELRASGTFDFIESQLQQAKQSLEEQEQMLSRYKVQRLGELPQQEAALAATLGRLHSQLQGVQNATEQAQQNKLMLENTLRLAESAEAMLARSIEEFRSRRTPVGSVSLAGTQQAAAVEIPESARIAAEIERLEVRYNEEHPEMKRLRFALQEAKSREEKQARVRPRTPEPAGSAPAPVETTAGVPPTMVLELNRERERVANTKLQLAVIDKQIAARNVERDRILAEVRLAQARLEKVPIREQELSALTRDYENSQLNYKSLLDKKLSAEMASEMEKRQQAEHFTLLDPAHVPTKPLKPNRPLFYAAGAGLAFVIALAIPFAIELKKDSILGEWELPTNAPVLARIPLMKPAARMLVMPGGSRKAAL